MSRMKINLYFWTYTTKMSSSGISIKKEESTAAGVRRIKAVIE